MTYQEIHDLYSAAPFQPFHIVLTNRTRLLVDHPEFMAFSRDHRTVYVSKRDGGNQRIDIKLIVTLDDVRNGSRRRRRTQ